MIKRTNIKIGLIGEDPNDTNAIANLLKQKYATGFSFMTISQNIRGCQMFTDNAIRSYNFEIKSKTPDHVVVIMDADATKNEAELIRAKQERYYKIRKGLKCESNILLLNIYELEALIIADIETCNNYYKSDINFKGDVMHVKDPKGLLVLKTSKGKKYHVSHCPDLFKTLQFDIIIKKCAYFKEFITEFEKTINS